MTDQTGGPGHNEPLDPDGESGLEAVRDYQIGVAKEQAGRDRSPPSPPSCAMAAP